MPAEILRYRLLNPMLKAVEGTISCVCMALDHGWSINLSGGYHHASKNSGGGFCIYPDITFAVHHLRKWHFDRVKKVLIIDLDAHQGNGYERDFLNDVDVFILDCFNPLEIINLVIFTQGTTMLDRQLKRKFLSATDTLIRSIILL